MAYIDMEINAQNLKSPRPMLKTLRAIESLGSGQVLKVTTDEPLSISNIEAICGQLGHSLMEIIDWDGEYTLLVKKA
ncbi:MAG: sulfurtransferase TusA family protein [Thioalkalispiraceae bacterium]|jgi:tRNA 2-thiouridine synthesizing protein A